MKVNISSHETLTNVAVNFLYNMGCREIIKEYDLYIKYKTRNGNGRKFIIDVFSVDKDIAIECGDTPNVKLLQLKGLVTQLFVLPYWSESPILLNGEIVHNFNESITKNFVTYSDYIKKAVVEYRMTFKDVTLKEIGKEFNISHERVRQILVKAKNPTYYKKCSKCGQTISGKKKICDKCQVPVFKKETISLHCSSCGNTIIRDKSSVRNPDQFLFFCNKQCQGQWLGIVHGKKIKTLDELCKIYSLNTDIILSYTENITSDTGIKLQDFQRLIRWVVKQNNKDCLEGTENESNQPMPINTPKLLPMPDNA